MTHKQEKNQPIETYQEMLDDSITNKELKTVIINMLHMPKKVERDMNIMRTEMKAINKA